ncbi:MAG: hypothetical protein BJ554DRAFT_936 [Olpidium bornovanus]|uniref:Uncharacterized protein n=1 Tax=Olpidium bornovanus TaxID=278681 RepID=A0A8H8DHU5_9FUNG|nr:MAG: hypothetical protein BJ554DRAFT_936 [Olpidium bornovanus]
MGKFPLTEQSDGYCWIPSRRSPRWMGRPLSRSSTATCSQEPIDFGFKRVLPWRFFSDPSALFSLGTGYSNDSVSFQPHTNSNGSRAALREHCVNSNPASFCKIPFQANDRMARFPGPQSKEHLRAAGHSHLHFTGR